jgi:hypothetical protein
MSALDVPRAIHTALTKQDNESTTKLIERRNVSMSMNQPNQNQFNALSGSVVNMSDPQLVKTPVQYNVYDPRTGRTALVNSEGRRVTKRTEMTGSQLVAINSFRKQVGLQYMSDRNVKFMSIDTASMLIDDYQRLVAIMMKYAEKIKMMEDTMEAMANDPQVAAQITLQRQAERVQKEK